VMSGALCCGLSASLGCVPFVDDVRVDAPAMQGAFDALTYNVAGLPEGLSGSEPQDYIPLISPRLNAYDLVLVQEDFTYQRELRADVDHAHQSAPLEDYERLVGDGLNRFSHFAFDTENVVRERWVECYGGIDFGSSDCLANKGFSVATHTLNGTAGVELVVVNFHAEAGGGPEDNAAREAGLDQLVAFLDEHHADDALVLGGDTNLHGFDDVDEPVLQDLMQRLDLDDACRALQCDDEHIDRFLWRSSSVLTLTPVLWRVADEMVTDDGEDLSDHSAIHTRFQWSVPTN